MAEHQTKRVTPGVNRWRIAGWTTAALLLLLPLVAMQFTDEVNWTATDFIVAGALLFGAGLISEFVMRKIKNINYKVVLLGAIIIIVILIWLELAVGIFGTPFSGN